MKIEFAADFNKEFKKIRDKKLVFAIVEIIARVKNANRIIDIQNLKKLKGHKFAYSIRSGNYRIGVKIEKNTVTFAAFDHRKDIYKHFP